MLLWGALSVLGLTLAGLTSLIVLDVGAKGWRNWVSTINAWQGTIGTVAGFLSAASVLMLSTAIQERNEVARAERAAASIGQALAIEVERMISPLEIAYHTTTLPDPENYDLHVLCEGVLTDLVGAMGAGTPVYDAVLANALDFGEYNLSLFTRFYGYYVDFHRDLAGTIKRCETDPEERIAYLRTISRGGFSYYQLVRQTYPGVTPLSQAVTDDLARANQPTEEVL